LSATEPPYLTALRNKFDTTCASRSESHSPRSRSRRSGVPRV
jgi:hypothetical protein